ncbi:dihydrodipicolinate synthase family protein [Magnetospirillum sp. UT-4]|uniref:dihydrodipicolinate synthase family protein n=1 Tax=Magnetospirillum sp. UT-4 TaxID=2681467 RepID=UPI0013808C88|nr:dihydrodipicolinate synthase family protein [Magnetospirillum sp. UT-4]CAA7621739.1 putative enzyme [Magnetospirillum sp. UT-4]
MTRFSGVLSTPMAPFDADGRLDDGRCDAFAAWQAESGVTGMFCLGTWGGFALLDMDERRRLTRSWCQAGRRHGVKVLIQVAAFSPADAAALAKLAEDEGADAAASVVPLYYSNAKYFSFDDYRNYFATLAKATRLPLYLYNNARTTGVLMTPKEFVALVEAGLAGVKDGSKDPGWILEAQDLLAQRGLSAEIIPGNTSAMAYAAAYGLQACMAGAAVCFPRLAAQSWAAMAAGNVFEGAALQRKLMAARRLLGAFGPQAPASHALLARMGHPLGTSRSPWPSIDAGTMDRLVEDLRQLGVPDLA